IATVAVCASLQVSTSLAQTATDAEMAEDALDPIVGSRIDAGLKSARIQDLHSRARERARVAPQELASATVVFNTGQSIREIGILAETLGLEITGLNVKAPLNDQGVIRSLLIGSDDLLRPRGSFETRAEHAIGLYRYEFLQWAEQLPPDEKEDVKKMAVSPMRIYGCEAVGTAQALSSLTQRSEITVVAFDSVEQAEERISSYTQLKKQYAEAWARLDLEQGQRN
ncbi:MAG: hypothetical protein L0Y45_00775, partial [Woeseiaceae bacterium]|nr:hypothetical protein [Woeseiaceae bacterium]